MTYFTTDSMSKLYQQMEYAPKRWLKNDLTKIEKSILSHREYIRVSLYESDWKFPMQSKLGSLLPNLIDSGKRQPAVPTLKPPTFFNRPLESDLKSQLNELLKNHSRQKEIEFLIERACLNLPTPEFYTLPLKNGYVIYGSGEATFGNLICLAHELGHALYELDRPGDEVGSEVAAFFLEDQIASLLLKDTSDKSEWANYKQAQDQLNYSLCLNEFSEFKTGISLTSKQFLFFRESLVTCWGYQCINTWASLQRNRSNNCGENY